MLQQTRVDAVLPYFEKFMEEVPDIESLAKISDDRLLKLWQGLGYYNRAMNLKKAANLIMEKFGGNIPSDPEKLKALPGIGPYTAGAIASIAFQARVPAVDGNVLRVISRLTANTGDITKTTVKKEIEDWLWQALPSSRVGDFNQALMDLGANVCLPNGEPQCQKCPLQSLCEGYRLGIADAIPVKEKKKERMIEQKTVFLILYRDKIAIRQRPNKGLLSKLWEFPHVDGHLSGSECIETLKGWGMQPRRLIPLGSAKHLFTHREWHMIGYAVFAEKEEDDQGFIWASPQEIEKSYSVPSAYKFYWKLIRKWEKDGDMIWQLDRPTDNLTKEKD